jgi:hypothetical protein
MKITKGKIMRGIYRNVSGLNREFAFLFALLFSCASGASTLQELSFAQVAIDAELVFEGEVVALESQYVADGTIRTFVRFAILEVIKGDYADDTIDLSYLGGQVGTRQMRISDMDMPSVGEVGIYFIESIRQPLLSPLVGWAQGHYVIELANGQSVVKTASGETVIGVSPGGVTESAENNTQQFSTGVAKGIVVPKSALARGLSKAMSVGEFKRSVREILDEQQP